MANNNRVAIFIDAENAAAKSFAEIVAKGKSLGLIRIMRCYGRASSLKKWEATNAEHHIVPVLTLSSAIKSNASDFAMTIDAVSLLHQNMFDHAIIASSDADFTQLAVHVRENGKGVHGVGNEDANDRLKKAFDSFSIFGAVTKSKAKVAVKNSFEKFVAEKPAAPATMAEKLPKQEFLETFKTFAEDENVTLSKFGIRLRKDHQEVKIQARGLKKMLIEAGFRVDSKNVVFSNP